MLRCLARNYSTKHFSISKILTEKPLGECDVYGWVRNLRKQKDFSFLDITDGTTAQRLQIVVPTKLLPTGSRHHSAIRVSGNLIESSHKGQDIELLAQEVEVLNSCEEPYPIQPKKHFSQNFVRQFPSYKSKTNSTASLLRIRNHLTQAINQYFQQNEFLHIHTPILTSNDCEGGGQVFKVSSDHSTTPEDQQSRMTSSLSITSPEDHQPNTKETKKKRVEKENESEVLPAADPNTSQEYFDKAVYLTVSGQLHLEAVCNGISKVYTFNPAFRAEKGRTRRHLSEFWMVEAEVAFVQDLSEILDIIEGLVKHVTAALLASPHRHDLAAYNKVAQIADRTDHLQKLISTDFHRITFQEAVSLVRENKDLSPVENDLGREHELYLCGKLGGPVFVYNWPKSGKPFYMKQCEQDSELVSCVDLLVPHVGELCGGGLREFDAQLLQSRIESSELDWYLDMRRKGSAPTGGFGLGFERLIQFLVGVENIKDTIPFYRTSHECQL